jgi:poly [ADP-ribose] polymerase
MGFTIVLDDVFAVKAADTTDDFVNYKAIRPRKLLWHGSRLCNYVGILNQGLRIAPPEAPVSGYMFGKGIYFADRVQKSIAFCHSSKENPTGLLLLADVVLGEQLELKKPEFIERLPQGKSSALALAKTIPDPNKDEFVEDKVIVPLGPGIPSEHKDVFLEDQEYIIYQRQVRIKYLVKIHVEYPKGK